MKTLVQLIQKIFFSVLKEDAPEFDPEEIIVVVCILIAIIIFISLLACFLNRRENNNQEDSQTTEANTRESLNNFKNTEEYRKIKEKALKEKLFYLEKSKIVLEESNIPKNKPKQDSKKAWVDDFGGDDSSEKALTINISQELDDDVRKNVRGKGRIKNNEPGFQYDFKRDSKVGRMLMENKSDFKNFTLIGDPKLTENSGDLPRNRLFDSPDTGELGENYVKSVLVGKSEGKKMVFNDSDSDLRAHKG